VSDCKRRQFLKTSLAGAGLALGAPRLLLGADAKAVPGVLKNGSDAITLGRTPVKTSFLALGTGMNGGNRASDLTRLGQAEFTRILRHGLDSGVRFLDAADLYGSHPFIRQAVAGVPRDSYSLLTKIWPNKEDWVTPSGGAREEVDRFRRELATDTLDVCLIHCMQNERWPEQYARIRDELSKLKDEGAVRAVGVSCHDHGALKRAAELPWVDVILARINHRGGEKYLCDDTSEAIAATLKRARANGKAVVGMKIYGAGTLTAPEERAASLKYVLGGGLVDAITIGTTAPAQVDDNLAAIRRALAA
jgi:aryl-alcohol dehydrogenase-like predicted oxidoreductase